MTGPRLLRTLSPVLLLLFVVSGAAALTYEIVWFQLLQLVIGSSGVSLAVLLGSFMGGLLAGSLLAARLPTNWHPLRVYAALEAAIGAFALIIYWSMPFVGALYSSAVGYGFANILLRAIVCMVLLLPPTILMGATLPAVSRWIGSTLRGVSWVGFLYAGNIVGAVIGCLAASFYLLRVHDTLTATLAGVACNGMAALIAWLLARNAPARAAIHGNRPEGELTIRSHHWPVYLAIALSGMSALGAEVIWTRLLSLLLGPTVYSFSLILAVYLAGLGLGSTAGARLARRVSHPETALGACQFLIVAGIGWTAYMLSDALPYWPIVPNVAVRPWFNFQVDLVRAMCAILPAPVFWGMSFPLAVACVAAEDRDPARLIGGVYAANTLGAILGAIGFAIFGIPRLGTTVSQRALVFLAVLAGSLALVPLLRARRNRGSETHAHQRVAIGWLVAGIVTAAVVAASISPVPPQLLAYGRYSGASRFLPSLIYRGEGMNASVAVTEASDGTRHFHVGGKTEASTGLADMRLQRLLGHLSALLHEQPTTVLVVGFGAGVTAGTFITHPSVQRIVICEIEPLIVDSVAKYFQNVNYDVLTDPRVEVVHDDARHYLRTTRESFDVITSDPIHPWVKGSAALYSAEYFELARRRLNPGGIVTQWVPLYATDEAVVKSEFATFFSAFPGGTVWGNTRDGQGYDVILAGGATATRIDVNRLQQRFAAYDHRYVRQSLNAVGFSSLLDVLERYAGQSSDLVDWMRGAEINRDRNLRLMYEAGLSVNVYEQGTIYEHLLGYRSFPGQVFGASPEIREELKKRLLVSR